MSGEPSAVKRARELLDEAHKGAAFDPAGYLNLLDTDRSERSPVMFAMRMPLVTKVYENWWRPGWGRLMKGFGGPSMADEYELANTLLELEQDSIVLDLACGPGNFTRRFARTVGPRGLAVGFDGSRPMLDRAVLESTELDNDAESAIAYALGDATELPFADGAFDAVCCFAALHLFPQPFATIEEIARVLKPGGHVAFHTSFAPSGGRGSVVKVIGPASGLKTFGYDELRDGLEDRGFVVQTQRVAGVTQLVSAVRT